jgi:hypothetical protein
MLGGLSIGHITMADILPFKSRFDLEAEAAVAAALFGIERIEQLTRSLSALRAETLANSQPIDTAPSDIA